MAQVAFVIGAPLLHPHTLGPIFTAGIHTASAFDDKRKGGAATVVAAAADIVLTPGCARSSLPAAAALPLDMRVILPLLRHIASSRDVRFLVQKMQKLFNRLNPSISTALTTILCGDAAAGGGSSHYGGSSVCEVHGEIIPVSILESVRSTFSDVSTSIHIARGYYVDEWDWLGGDLMWGIKSGIVPSRAPIDLRLRAGFDDALIDADAHAHFPPVAATAAVAEPPSVGDSTTTNYTRGSATAGDALTSSTSAFAPAFNFQRKIKSAVARVTTTLPSPTHTVTAASGDGGGGADSSSAAGNDSFSSHSSGTVGPLATAMAQKQPVGSFSGLLASHSGSRHSGSTTTCSSGSSGSVMLAGRFVTEERSQAVLSAQSVRGHAALTHTTPEGRPCQPIIVFASFIDKVRGGSVVMCVCGICLTYADVCFYD